MAQPIQQVLGRCLAPITIPGHELEKEDRKFVENDEQSGVGLGKRFFEHTLTLRLPVIGHLFPQFQLQLPDSQLLDISDRKSVV